MSTKPYLFAYALAFGVGVPILGISLKPSAPSAPNPKVDGHILYQMAFGGNASAAATPQDKPSASMDDAHESSTGPTALATIADLQGGTKRAELEPLANISMDFGTKPGLPSQPLVLSTGADSSASQVGGGVSSSGGEEFLPPPPIFGAIPFGSLGGSGGGGTGVDFSGSTSEGEYYLVESNGGFPGGPGLETGGFGDGGGGILFVGGDAAAPEPASWMLGFCAMGALMVLRAVYRRERK